MIPTPAVVLITGIQAAGKSTVAQLLAERLPRSVHLRGDAFRRMVVGGRADMTPDPSEEAVRQLRLRHRLTATAADEYFREGFTVVAQDVVRPDPRGDGDGDPQPCAGRGPDPLTFTPV